ncbi:AMP-binding protein [Phenylobacterium sp. J367]|nr:AMP-binding protein [Phenylobacterium sp. J367]MCR5879635.1 AMP-binding protein [Phenylobacterium sp. J367]
MQHAPDEPLPFSALAEFQRSTPPPEPLPNLLGRAAERWGDRPHLTYRDRSWTFRETELLARRLSTGLQELGVSAGDRVGVCLANLPHYPLACFGLWGIGAAGVGMNPLYSLRQLAQIASDSGAQWVIVSDHPDSIGKVRELAAQANCRLIICRADGLDLAGGPGAATEGGEVALAELLGADPAGAWGVSDTERLAMIQYTGGTTGPQRAPRFPTGTSGTPPIRSATGCTGSATDAKPGMRPRPSPTSPD